MNLVVEKKRRSPAAKNRLVYMLEGMDHLTLTAITAPTEELHGKRASSGDCMDVPPGSDHEDDFANAIWEDAEWQ